MTSPDPTTGSSMAQADFAADTTSLSVKEHLNEYWQRVRNGEPGALPAIAAFAVLCTIFAIADKSGTFITTRNFANLITQAAPYVVISMGVTFVLLLGDIDLSAGATAGLCAAVLGKQLSVGHSLVYCLTLALVAGVLIGLFTGLLVAKVGIPSFVVTLALFLAWQGGLLKVIGDGGNISIKNPTINGIENANLSAGAGWAWLIGAVVIFAAIEIGRVANRRRRNLTVEPMAIAVGRTLGVAVIGLVVVVFLNQNRAAVGQQTKLLGVPRVVPVLLILLVGLNFLLNRTRFGRHLYAVGGNSEAARRAGINVVRVKIAAFVLCGLISAVGGIVLASRLNSVDPQTGLNDTLLLAVGAAVVGGTSLFGGRGKMRNAILGGFVIMVIPNGLGLLKTLLGIRVDAGFKYIVQGGVLLIAASVDALSRRRNNAS